MGGMPASKPLCKEETSVGYLTDKLEIRRKNSQASALYGVRAWFLLSSRAFLSPVIVPAPRALVTLLVGAGGAPPPAVPVAAEGGSN